MTQRPLIQSYLSPVVLHNGVIIREIGTREGTLKKETLMKIKNISLMMLKKERTKERKIALVEQPGTKKNRLIKAHRSNKINNLWQLESPKQKAHLWNSQPRASKPIILETFLPKIRQQMKVFRKNFQL